MYSDEANSMSQSVELDDVVVNRRKKLKKFLKRVADPKSLRDKFMVKNNVNRMTQNIEEVEHE